MRSQHSYDDFVAAVRQKGKHPPYNDEEKKLIEQTINSLNETVLVHRLKQHANGETQLRLQGELTQQLEDQKDIFQYLNGELNKKTDEIIKLEKNLNHARSLPYCEQKPLLTIFSAIAQCERDSDNLIREKELELQKERERALLGGPLEHPGPALELVARVVGLAAPAAAPPRPAAPARPRR